eukprot:scaffold1901_cov106-Isochrysis_galbana.AAC.2
MEGVKVGMEGVKVGMEGVKVGMEGVKEGMAGVKVGEVVPTTSAEGTAVTPCGIGAHGVAPLHPWPGPRLAFAGVCALGMETWPKENPPASPGASAAAELCSRLEAIRAAGPGAAAHLLAAEDAAVQAALLRRLEARNRGGGWVRSASWLLAPIVPCVISMLAARYHSQGNGGGVEL